MADKKKEIVKPNAGEQWINTPFSFTKIDKQYSLSQQHVLFCVSSHLQEYVTRFFNEKREKGGLRSDYLFEVDKEHVAMNVPKIRLKLNELGIDSSHYKDLRKALKELLDFSVRIKIDGKVVIQHVFSNITEDVVINGYTKEGVAYDRSKGEVELKIDPVVAKYAFDMSQGFIHHMAMIARYANRANTPRIYLFLLRQMGINKGKMTFQVPFMALKEYLGMATLSADGTVVEEQYPKFSQFKKQVLDAVKADFAKLSKEDKTDIVFTDCSPVYKRGQTRGNPEALLFKVKRTALGKAHIDGKVLERKEQKMGKANKEPVIGDLFAHVNTTESPKIKIVKGGEDKWQSFQAMIIDPSQQALLKRFKFVGMKNDRFCVKATQEDFDLLRTLGVEDIAKEFFNCKGSYSPTFYRD